MNDLFFSALLTDHKPIGDGTAGALVSWLETYLQALFPENSIEYWSRNEWSEHPLDLKPSDLILTSPEAEVRYRSAACWTTPGTSEGQILEVYLLRYDRFVYRLAWVKTFDSTDTCWRMVRALQAALEEYLLQDAVPAVVSLYQAFLVHKKAIERRAPANEPLTLNASAETLQVLTTQGQVLFEQHFTGTAAQELAQAYLTDCRRVLGNLGLSFTETVSL